MLIRILNANECVQKDKTPARAPTTDTMFLNSFSLNSFQMPLWNKVWLQQLQYMCLLFPDKNKQIMATHTSKNVVKQEVISF